MPARFARLVDAGGDQHGVVPRPQFFQRDVLADAAVQHELDAGGLVLRVTAQHDVLFQLEVGDAVDHQAADAVVAVIDRDLPAAQPQPLGGREASRSGADDADGMVHFPRRRRRLHPAHVPGGVGDIALHRADGDAVEALLDDAIAFAEPVLRANAAADLGEGIGGGRDLVGFFQPAFGGQLQPVRDIVVQRAMHGTERHAALGTAAGLLAGALRREALVDLAEIGASLGRAALVRHLLGQAHELQHAFGHGDGLPWGRKRWRICLFRGRCWQAAGHRQPAAGFRRPGLRKAC
jgi:hypothetical protein